jgi:hypothetical protein
MVWKYLSASFGPPRSRTYAIPFGRLVRSMTASKPSDRMDKIVLAMNSLSVLPIRKIPRP